MIRLKQFSLAYAFQIFGVIILFGYPGCASNIKEQEPETGKTDLVEKTHAAVKAVVNKAPEIPGAGFSLKQPQATQINFASYLDFSR